MLCFGNIMGNYPSKKCTTVCAFTNTTCLTGAVLSILLAVTASYTAFVSICHEILLGHHYHERLY